MAAPFNMTTATNLFKKKYGVKGDNLANVATPLLSRIKKKGGFVGDVFEQPYPSGFIGSIGGSGGGGLPAANAGGYKRVSFGAKPFYGRLQIDRQTMYACRDEGGFVDLLGEAGKRVVESYVRGQEFLLTANGDGILGVIDTGGVSGTNPYTIVISAASWIAGNWEERDYVNVSSGSTDRFEVTSVTEATRTIVLTRISGSKVPAQGESIYLQGMQGVSPQGLWSVCSATGGSLYGETVDRRWQATQLDVSGDGLSVDRMNQVVNEMRRKCGKNPTDIYTSFTQFRKFQNLLEDQKRYPVPMTEVSSRGSNNTGGFKGIVSWKGLEYMTDDGPIPVFASRFVRDDEMFFTNTNFIEEMRREGYGWFEDDGSMLMRLQDSDAYDGRFGGYYENFIVPTYQGYMYNLATTA